MDRSDCGHANTLWLVIDGDKFCRWCPADLASVESSELTRCKVVRWNAGGYQGKPTISFVPLG